MEITLHLRSLKRINKTCFSIPSHEQIVTSKRFCCWSRVGHSSEISNKKINKILQLFQIFTRWCRGHKNDGWFFFEVSSREQKRDNFMIQFRWWSSNRVWKPILKLNSNYQRNVLKLKRIKIYCFRLIMQNKRYKKFLSEFYLSLLWLSMVF